jgi:hypothetical protein
MQPADHRSADEYSARIGLIRGILVILTAVAIGAFVITQGLDDRRLEPVAAGNTTVEADSEGSGQAEDLALTTTTLEAAETTVVESTTTEPPTTEPPETTMLTEVTQRLPSEVEVLVLNGAGTKGIAAQGAERVQGAGYEVLAPKNANNLGPSQILYIEDYETEARDVAAVFGVDPDALVSAYDPASPPIDEIREAKVIVIIGQDDLIIP